MENASKALIIAGAILLAIVIISLGLVVVNNVRNVTDNTNLSEQEIQSFNAKFIAYEGENVSGSRVNSLIQQVISTNQALYNEGKTDQMVNMGFMPSSWSSSNAYIKHAKNTDVILAKNAASSLDLDDIKKDPDETSGSAYRDISDSSKWTGTGGQPTMSVKTGVTYKVTIGYKNGLVKAIAIAKN